MNIRLNIQSFSPIHRQSFGLPVTHQNILLGLRWLIQQLWLTMRSIVVKLGATLARPTLCAVIIREVARERCN
jgi:hypothetical protein